jgi:transcriptional regulator with XRE-family HTH domain
MPKIFAVKPRPPSNEPDPLRGGELSEKILVLRQRLGYSQETLARQIGMSHRHLSAIESGTRAAGALTLMRLAWLAKAYGHTDIAGFFSDLLKKTLLTGGLRRAVREVLDKEKHQEVQ